MLKKVVSKRSLKTFNTIGKFGKGAAYFEILFDRSSKRVLSNFRLGRFFGVKRRSEMQNV